MLKFLKFKKAKYEVSRGETNLVVPKFKIIKIKTNHEYPKRYTWGRNIEFALSLIGYAVSLGNIWRFPYLCYRNGGGAFLIPYWLMLFTCGIPLFFLEVTLGQFTSTGAIDVWNICPLFKGVGIGTVLLTFIGSMPYNLLIGLIMYFLFASFKQPLPWSVCGHNWNSPGCIVLKSFANNNNNSHMHNNYNNKKDLLVQNISYSISNSNPINFYNNSYITLTNNNLTLTNNNNNNNNHAERYDLSTQLSHHLSLENGDSIISLSDIYSSSVHEFWSKRVLEITDGIHDLGSLNPRLLGCFILAWIITYLCLRRGIKTAGKVVYFTATLPYLILTILLVRCAILPGALNGILFFLKPDWTKLKNIRIWNEAATQIFYSLGPGWSGIITMASYNKFRHNCLRDSIIVSLVNCGTSVYAGLVVFSVVGFMSYVLAIPIDKVATQGVALAFIVYPEALLHLKPANFWAVLFFAMLLAVGIDTIFVELEVLYSAIYDCLPQKYKTQRSIFTLVSSVIIMLLGLPYVTHGGIYLFQLLDWYLAILSVMIFCMFETITVSWIYGAERFVDDIEFMLDRPLPFSKIWIFLWKFIIPSLLFVALVFNVVFHVPVQYGNYIYPNWAILIGWAISISSLLPIPLYAFYIISRNKESTLKKKILSCIKPSSKWGPSNEPFRTQYILNKQIMESI